MEGCERGVPTGVAVAKVKMPARMEAWKSILVVDTGVCYDCQEGGCRAFVCKSTSTPVFIPPSLSFCGQNEPLYHASRLH